MLTWCKIENKLFSKFIFNFNNKNNKKKNPKGNCILTEMTFRYS